MKNKLQIFVVAHKPSPIPQSEVLVPIHVGRAASRYQEEMGDYIGDDTGENISAKNPQYCEMTAHYWIWKNVKDTEYVGVCHYRRFFAVEITEYNISEVMGGDDVLLVEPSWYMDSVYSYFAKFMGAENMTILWMVMKKLYPEYTETLETVCDGVKFYPFNMLLCKKHFFDEYCKWMFSILEECERYVKPSPYTNGRRALAYMAELLTGVYFIHRRMKIKTVPYYKVEDGKKIMMVRSEEETILLKRYEDLLNSALYQKVKFDRIEKFKNPAILLGLKNDGIKIIVEY